MMTELEAKLLRIYIGEKDTLQDRTLHGELLRVARERHMAGGTVVRGIEGFGGRAQLHRARVLRRSEDLPLIVEIIDTPEAVDAFLEVVDGMIGTGTITVERVSIRSNRSRAQGE